MTYLKFFKKIVPINFDWIKKFALLPDLTFSGYNITSSGNLVNIDVKVINIGKAKSGETFVYFNAIDTSPPPGKNEIRIQYRKNLPELSPGEEKLCKFNLTTQQVTNEELNRVDILIDPKNLVNELNENNNLLQLGL